jgi:cell division initiation protein
MIDLTPLEVRKKKEDFRRALRGYEPVDVDTFLDLVADRMEQLVRENLALSEKAGRLEEEIAAYRERERALTDALVSAQEMREELRRQAARDAEELRRAAEAEAERLRDGVRQALQREETALRELRARRARLVQEYRAMLERELNELSVLLQTLEIAEEKDELSLGTEGFAAPSLSVEGGPVAAAGPAAPATGIGSPSPFPAVSPMTPAVEGAVAAESDAGSLGADLELDPLAGSEQERSAAKPDEGKPGGSAAKAQDEQFPESLDWLSSLLREDP